MAILRSWIKTLLIYDTSDFVIRHGAEAFLEEAPPSNAKEGVSDFEGALRAMSKYCQVESLIFETHGAPGYVHFPKGGITWANACQFRSATSALQTGARVLFEGCSVGAGEVGRNFLIAVGSNLLLGKGGFVGATDSKNIGSPLETFSLLNAVRMPPWGNLRIIQFGLDGSVIREEERGGAVMSAP
jgi:hypothetical protein